MKCHFSLIIKEVFVRRESKMRKEHIISMLIRRKVKHVEKNYSFNNNKNVSMRMSMNSFFDHLLSENAI